MQQQDFTEQLDTATTALLHEANEIQQLITTAKTDAKREFYRKKMKKLAKTLHQALALKELNARQTDNGASTV